MRQDQRSRTRVVAPEEKRLTVLEIRRRDIRTKGVTESGILVPVTHVGRRYPVGAAERVK